jgi:CopA family copper-resistance protein
MNSIQAPDRRLFVQGLAAAGVAGLAAPVHAREAPGTHPVLRGKDLDLTLAEMPVNITGRRRIATVVNNAMPGPILRLHEGDHVTIRVTNRLNVSSSVHWHGLRLPNAMDGVPGLTYAGIAPGETFVYRFPVLQAGTYWYHSHSGMQEQTGLSGPIIIDPAGPDPIRCDRENVIQLSDWTDEDPMTIVANLKQQGDYYNYHQRTLGTFISDVGRNGLDAALNDRLMWGGMRMSPTDILDVTGAVYTFLINGQPPAVNWTALFRPGEAVRLRFINSAAMTTFDVRIPGLAMTVVQADGSDVQPVEVEEFRIGVAETYDVIVVPGDGAYTIFAQAQDRSGYARATLTSRAGTPANVPPMDPPPLRTMADMGMAGMNMHGGHGSSPIHDMEMEGMAPVGAAANASGVDPQTLAGQPFVDNLAPMPASRLQEAGTGLDGSGRRTLRYSQLKALEPAAYTLEPSRDIEFHLTGNMERWTWGFDGKKFSDAPPIRVALGETVRFVLINDTMMEHPIHLHGFLFRLENEQGDSQPLKHTVNVKPGERVGIVFTADVPGYWAFHCHLLYHMEAGMFRTVIVA